MEKIRIREGRKMKQLQRRDHNKQWLVNFVPGFLVGLVVGLWMQLPIQKALWMLNRSMNSSSSNSEELKMVFVVRRDLKMGGGKIASQCAHAAVGIYRELMRSERDLLSRWEVRGQAKIVVTCKNQQEMNELREKAQRIGLPTFIIADAGRTQVAAGSKTVLVIGPGSKPLIDSVTRHLRLL